MPGRLEVYCQLTIPNRLNWGKVVWDTFCTMAWFSKKAPPKTASPQTASSSAKKPAAARLSEEEHEFLVQACRARTSCTVTWPTRSDMRPGHLEQVSEGQLLLNLDSDGPEYEYMPLNMCVVSFFFNEQMTCFIGYEEATSEAKAAKNSQLLAVRMPTKLAAERRTRFRIPVLASLDLRATLYCGDRVVPVSRCCDINNSGVMIVFPKGDDPDLELQSAAELELALETDSCQVPCTVRRKRETDSVAEYGLLFGIDVEDTDSMAELNTIIRLVERFWAQNRKDR